MSRAIYIALGAAPCSAAPSFWERPGAWSRVREAIVTEVGLRMGLRDEPELSKVK